MTKLDPKPLASHYDSAQSAATYMPVWDQAGYARGNPDAPGRSFSVVIPPPNVTGSLHMGHALNNTIQDVLVRYHRMDGDNVVWVPGFDHASIAVHWLLERQLRSEGLSRQSIGREDFLQRAWAFKEEVEQKICIQQKKLGLSCDWERKRFTLDEGLSEAVREAFVALYEDGLIYRAEKLVNWDPVSRTSVSDLEVVYEDNVTQELYQFAYMLEEGCGELVVATTRPETMLGDTAVAVHPQDERYKHLIGRKLRHPFVDRLVPIIGDAILVDPEFGSGAVKITPAHDFNDFEVGQRHGLEMINLLNPDGTLNESCKQFSGLSVTAARTQICASLDELGLGRGSVPHKLNLGRSERSGAILEPMLSPQWYVRAKPLARPALQAVRHQATRFVPDGWKNTYNSWLTDIRDWCISRQLWWGHRIPAWNCVECGHLHVQRTDPTVCASCESKNLLQDPDVLDTWFSSALWPFSVHGWPNQSKALARWYPTQVLVTSFDIIFFWVARMMMMGQHLTGQVPFAEVYIHALVRDGKGEKMSKTKGNVVDPLVMIERYGCDAFRLALVACAAQGRDVRWDEGRAQSAQKFVNKLWQSLRFVVAQLPEDEPLPPPRAACELDLFDRWVLGRLHHAIGQVRGSLDNSRFNEAAQALMTFVWDELCDWYLEAAKTVLYDESAASARKDSARRVLLDCLGAVARMLHPIAPFLGEELYQQLKARDPGSSEHGVDAALHVVTAQFPKQQDYPTDASALAEADFVADIIVGVRRMRADYNLPPKQPIEVLIRTTPKKNALLISQSKVIAALARAGMTALTGNPPEQSATCLVGDTELFLPLGGLVDFGAEIARITKELERAKADETKLHAQLERADFLARAPEEVVADKRAQLAHAQAKQVRLAAALGRLN